VFFCFFFQIIILTNAKANEARKNKTWVTHGGVGPPREPLT